MRENPVENEIYRHFKGDLYSIVTIAEHSESKEKLVIYKAMYGDGKVYARPLDMFMSEVDKNKYPDAEQTYRFEKQESIIDPVVIEFLDADTYEERLKILSTLHSRITDDMINTMAASVDLEINDGDIEKRYTELKNCLLTRDKFECSRLR